MTSEVKFRTRRGRLFLPAWSSTRGSVGAIVSTSRGRRGGRMRTSGDGGQSDGTAEGQSSGREGGRIGARTAELFIAEGAKVVIARRSRS